MSVCESACGAYKYVSEVDTESGVYQHRARPKAALRSQLCELWQDTQLRHECIGLAYTKVKKDVNRAYALNI
jgi:hypothetical protein